MSKTLEPVNDPGVAHAVMDTLIALGVAANDNEMQRAIFCLVVAFSQAFFAPGAREEATQAITLALEAVRRRSISKYAVLKAIVQTAFLTPIPEVYDDRT